MPASEKSRTMGARLVPAKPGSDGGHPRLQERRTSRIQRRRGQTAGRLKPCQYPGVPPQKVSCLVARLLNSRWQTAAGIPAATSVRLLKRTDTISSCPSFVCVQCNYQLQQIAATRCPECGSEFDPANRLTVNHGRELTPVARWSLAPGGAIAALALLVATGGAAWLARLPPGVHDRTPINGTLVVLMGVVWLSWSTVRRWSAKRNGWQAQWFVVNRVVRRWPGVVAIVIGVAILFGVPRRIAFRVSERRLGQIAETLMNSRKKAPDQWAGVFHATSILRVPGGGDHHDEPTNRQPRGF